MRTESNPSASNCRVISGPAFATDSENCASTSDGFVLNIDFNFSVVVPIMSAYDFNSGPPSRTARFMSSSTLLNEFAAWNPSSPILLIAVDRPITAVCDIPTVAATGASAFENDTTDGTEPPIFAVVDTSESDSFSNCAVPLPIVFVN